MANLQSGKHVEPLLGLQAGSNYQNGQNQQPPREVDPILEGMKRRREPLNRQNYLEQAYAGNPPAELSAEEESMLPAEFQDWSRFEK